MTEPTKPLSPPTQAVLTAFVTSPHCFDLVKCDRPARAAALRAAADHIDHDCSALNCIDSLCEIATELEATP